METVFVVRVSAAHRGVVWHAATSKATDLVPLRMARWQRERGGRSVELGE